MFRARRGRNGNVNVRVELVERVLQRRLVADAWADLDEAAILLLDEVAVRRDVRQVRICQGNGRRRPKQSHEDGQNN